MRPDWDTKAAKIARAERELVQAEYQMKLKEKYKDTLKYHTAYTMARYELGQARCLVARLKKV
jgi:hypothetical protein